MERFGNMEVIFMDQKKINKKNCWFKIKKLILFHVEVFIWFFQKVNLIIFSFLFFYFYFFHSTKENGDIFVMGSNYFSVFFIFQFFFNI